MTTEVTTITVGDLLAALADLPRDIPVAISYEGIYRGCTVVVEDVPDGWPLSRRPKHRACVVLDDNDRYPFR